MSNYTASQKCLKLIREFEGFEPKAYICPAGVLSIGIGTTINTKEEEYLKKAVINEVQAFTLLKKDMITFEKTLNNTEVVKVKLNQNQVDGILVFMYNVGAKAFTNSTLLKKININPNDPSIKDEFLKWNKIDASKNKKDDDGDGVIDEIGEKKAIDGLTNRRKAEIALYFS